MKADIDPHDEYYSRESVPVLPPVINGKTYFNKAKDRDRAVMEGRATDPLPSNFYKLPRTYERLGKMPVPSVRFHWNGGSCAKDSWAWGAEARSRVLDGAAFDDLSKSSQCQRCRCEFEQA